MLCSPQRALQRRCSLCAPTPSCLKPAASPVAGAGVGAGIRRLPRRQRYADWRVRQHCHVGRGGSRRLPHQLLQLAVCRRPRPAGVGGSRQCVHAAALLHVSHGIPHKMYPIYWKKDIAATRFVSTGFWIMIRAPYCAELDSVVIEKWCCMRRQAVAALLPWPCLLLSRA